MKTLHYVTTLSVAIVSGSLAILTAKAASNQTATKTPAGTTAAAAPSTPAPSTPAAAKPTVPPEQPSTAAAAAKKTATPDSEGRAWFGAIGENTKAPANAEHPKAPEVRLSKVFRDSPAYAAGLRPGDILWTFNGGRLESTAQFQQELHQQSPGTTVPVEIYRQGQRKDMKVKLGRLHHATAQHSGTAKHAHA